MGIAIVGIGLNSPLGSGLVEHTKVWNTEEFGFKPITCCDTDEAQLKFAGEMNSLWNLPVPQKKIKKMVNRKDYLALATAWQALQDSQIDFASLDPFRKSVFVGSCATQIEDFHPYFSDVLQCVDFESLVFDSARFGAKALSEINPLSAVKVLTNGALAHISQSFEFKGANCNFMDYELGGFMALDAGVAAIQDGRSDCSLVGAVSTPLDPFQLSDPITQYDLLRGSNLQEIIEKFKPGYQESEGRMVGEGACFFVLEDEDSATKRGAKIYGVIHNTAQSALGQSLPFAKSSYTSVERCLSQAQHSEAVCILNFNGSPQFDSILAQSLPSRSKPLHCLAPMWQTGDLSEVASLYNISWALTTTGSTNRTEQTSTYNKNYKLLPSYRAGEKFQVLTMSRFGAAGIIEVSP